MDLQQSLEQLECDIWPDPSEASHLTKECHRLRRYPVKDLTAEHLRMLIGQKIGLLHLVPVALDVLELNPLVEGGMYRGDLLCSVSSIDSVFWEHHHDLKDRLLEIRGELEVMVDTINHELLPALEGFE